MLAQGGFEYPKKFANILEKMINLNPLSELVSFANIVKILRDQSSEDF